MIRQSFMTLLLLVAAGDLAGQGRMEFSVHANPQFSWFGSDSDSISPDGARFHLHAGLNMDYYFQEKYAFYLGFGINNTGGKLHYHRTEDYLTGEDTLVLGPDRRYRLGLQYLDVPLGLKLRTEELGYTSLMVQLGFDLMFNTNAHFSGPGDIPDKAHVGESIPLFQLGYHAGLGVEYSLGGSTAVLGGIRWSSGFTNVTEKDGANITLNALSIHAGLLF